MLVCVRRAPGSLGSRAPSTGLIDETGTRVDRQRPQVAGRVRVLIGVVVGFLVIMVAAATPAAAHARLLGANPEPGAVLDSAPARVELRFSEPVGLIAGSLRLFAADGRVTALDAHSRDAVVSADLPALPDGGYTIGFRVVSADGHPISGAVSFHVGATAGSPPLTVDQASTPVTDAVVAALSAAQTWTLLVFAGLVFFRQFVQRGGTPADQDGLGLLRTLLLVAGAASLALVPAGASRVVGAEPWGVAGLGWLAGVRPEPVAAALVIAGAGWLALRASGRSGRTQRWAAPLAGIALAALVLVGHTRTIGPAWLMAVADFGHLFAAAVWTGGLVGLIRLLVRVEHDRRTHANHDLGTAATLADGTAALGGARRGPAVHGEREVANGPVTLGDGQPDSAVTIVRAVGRVVGRFSQLALVSVLMLAASGTIMAIMVVGSWSMLVESGYGRTLLLKLGVVVAVVAIAGWNRFVLLPRIERAADDAASWYQLLRTLRREAALLVAVVAITGVLTNTSPPPAVPDQPAAAGATAGEVTIHAISQGMTVDGTVSPGTTGANRLRLRLSVAGTPLTTDEVTVIARLPEQDLGPLSADVSGDPESGEYLAEIVLPVAGSWRLEIAARLDTFTKPTAVATITIV